MLTPNVVQAVEVVVLVDLKLLPAKAFNLLASCVVFPISFSGCL
jgi:hypothetical protein